MKAYAVIGMNYGDEGKGHITNYLSDANTLNVRFNGGAQASHAVFLSDGRSHVFHHFGAGSLRGARTLLASHFIVNPVIFAWEMQDLVSKAPMREIFVDPRCRVTTPYDMLINEFSSQSNGKKTTVGVGINETVERSVYQQLRINIRDFIEKTDDELTDTLKTIENEYLPFRIKELGLSQDDFAAYISMKMGKGTPIESFLKIREWMASRILVMWPDDGVVDKFLAKDQNRKVVFEAGQGMLLDQHRKEFMPYLTRSNTGLQNVLELLKTVKTKLDLTVYLVTRAYLSRHGDGPLWNHIPNTLPFQEIDDPTNPENAYQGKMRYGYINRKWYDDAISETENLVAKNRPTCLDNAEVAVAMTCLDHVGSQFFYSKNGTGNFIEGDPLTFPRIKLVSYGNMETNIHEGTLL